MEGSGLLQEKWNFMDTAAEERGQGTNFIW